VSRLTNIHQLQSVVSILEGCTPDRLDICLSSLLQDKAKFMTLYKLLTAPEQGRFKVLVDAWVNSSDSENRWRRALVNLIPDLRRPVVPDGGFSSESLAAVSMLHRGRGRRRLAAEFGAPKRANRAPD
jgi:hypothetical protein